MIVGRFMTDARLRDSASHLGLRLTGIGRFLGPLEVQTRHPDSSSAPAQT
jgi:hypothetical protein